MGRALARLIADRGEAARSDDFFRCRPFLEAEGVTHTLRIERDGGELLLPLLVRAIDGSDRLDAISPYGYPGATARGSGTGPQRAGDVDWSESGLVSLFVRDRLTEPHAFAEGNQRSVVQVHDPARPRHLRSRFAEQIRRNERNGLAVEALANPVPEAVESFHAAYIETMRRAEAAERYLYPPEYFATILAFERSWLLTGRTSSGELAAGAVAAVSDGLLHYYLGGTADAHLSESPFKNVVEAMIELSGELDVSLNLGGSVRPGDGLENFKRGFSNAERPFVTQEIVCDPDAYAGLTGERDAGDFFPAYRAPA